MRIEKEPVLSVFIRCLPTSVVNVRKILLAGHLSLRLLLPAEII